MPATFPGASSVLTVITIEAKDDGQLPTVDVLIQYISDLLNNHTKHNSELGWWITSVERRTG